MLLARREHGRAELARKLQQKGFETNDIEQALQELEARGYQNDQRYAESYARSRVQLGYGELYIRNALESQGIDRSLITTALQQLCAEEWTELAASVYQRRYAAVDIDQAEREKRLRFMMARGFSFSQVKLAMTGKND